ncbi:MAG TPA: 2-succinyl-5-enolpyruvyl-6-hydroxy-3-cyclohexene-1-carboxylic-acid synthase [Acidimicrobiales bacterium]|nr:2-succinyl-5-enolpyruvyl-6-hydroxy-3-cyclohexene-1-carboxylic-acid synthase [Acidimicrobiales bacterium]
MTDGAPLPQDVAATFCATVVDEWARAGVTDAVVCPGSRSTPMALALAAEERIRVHVHHDERAGAFTALGLGLATGRPAVVLTTSGTAAAELHPAVVEAHHAWVPLLAVTADRPPELGDVGAPQTIDQHRLFGPATRWSHAPGVPDPAARSTWRAVAARAVLEATGTGGGPGPGPVHLDLAFREPLVGTAGTLPEGRAGGAPWTTTAPRRIGPDLRALDAVLRTARRGVVVAGAEPGAPVSGPGSVANAAPRIASALGWPLLLDARVRAGLEGHGVRGAAVVAAADALLRHGPTAEALRPDVVLHLGAPPASRVVAEWLAGSGATHVRVQPVGWSDPALDTALRVAAPAAGLVEAMGAADGAGVLVAPATEPGWPERWATAEAAAQGAIAACLAGHPEATEPGVARAVLAALADGDQLVVSSSMPVRDLEWYGRPRSGVRVWANRGANGIDGVASTALGVALGTGRPTACLVGDVALLHDGNALLGAAARGVDLTVVVVDNDGGGIFSFLPQATEPGGPTFEALFGTPHGVDLRVLAAAHGLVTVEPAGAAEVGPAVVASLRAGGVRLVRVVTDRAANVEVHRRVHTTVAAALDPS